MVESTIIEIEWNLNFGKLIYKSDSDGQQLTGKLSEYNKIKQTLLLEFNINCLNEFLLPWYTYIIYVP